jgi:GntR family transcriptional regulator / MocR family aminotransferase
MKTFEAVFLDRGATKPLQVQLQQHLRNLIQSGKLSAGKALPSTRSLSVQLNISRNTVVTAYEQLISEAYLEARPRSGIYVSSALSQFSSERVVRTQRKPRAPSVVEDSTLLPPVPFRPCQPDVSLFPLALWNRYRGRVVRRDGLKLLQYNEHSAMGLRALRENIATYLRDGRGVKCDWRQIAITSGSQHAIFLLAHVLLKSGKKVYLEDPDYNGTKRIMNLFGAGIISGQVDEQGLRPPLAKDQPISFVYVTPSRQFPTGATLSLPRRLELIQEAAKTNTWIVEDDYDSDFRYRAAPLPSLQSLDTNDKVIYVGTFSKVLFPSLRMGYIALPKALLEDFLRVKYAVDQYGHFIEQATLSAFIENGALHSHIGRCKRHYAQRQEVFLESAARLGLPLDFRYKDGGMNLTGFLQPGMDDQECSKMLSDAGLDIPPLSSFSIKRSEPGLVFGFTAFGPQKICSSLECVAQVARRW